MDELVSKETESSEYGMDNMSAILIKFKKRWMVYIRLPYLHYLFNSLKKIGTMLIVNSKIYFTLGYKAVKGYFLLSLIMMVVY